MRLISTALALVIATSSLAYGQGRIAVRSAVFYESYKFDAGLVFDEITELTIPVQVDIPVGRYAALAVSTGYVSVDLKSAVDEELFGDQSLSGMLDTQVRLSVPVMGGNLVILGTSTLPTGKRSVHRGELSILGALASDVIGFAAAKVGSGGDMGGGFAGAVPVGNFALGFGATYQQPFSYQPVVGLDTLLRRGAELRGRLGLQGPLARRTYLRVTGLYVMRQKDQLSGATQNGVGNRIVGYASVNQGFGQTTLTLYGFDVYRGSPQLEASAIGASVIPRGNLVAFGARLQIQLGRSTLVTPQYEYRISAAAADTSDTTLRRAGKTMRIGGSVRRSLSQSITVVFQCNGVTGNVVQAGTEVGLRGFRAGLHLEITR